ncbi:type II secretion system protein [Leifsonia naganoensis]|uniref:Prepilin-type N-terminal cleavage/methylation domain-containing protein n=1 Tax=Leifsonia naganoensis TaxID=150025 RepID=A0A853DNU5_9MICO|nr:type II secretion system protein [Leifsonia naganoensis]NYK10746.1 prepilin-type N-terminal cleavage/methylation domain-containing protein [Leifsonia naganoensis]
MSVLLARLRRIRTSESGVSLIEVIVAMMIFAIISVGVAYSLLSAFTITGDSRARAVATNLAAQEIDLDRSSGDLFSLFSTDTDKQVQVPAGTGLTYSIKRIVSWVYGTGSDVDCNASATSSILYKRVRVEVRWPNMIGQAVTSDTVLAPGTKISVDTLGTILVSTKSAAGAPVGGVGVSVTPNPGSVPTATDSMGCSYVLKVPTATYTVTASKTGYVDPYQNATPSKTVTAKAGQSTSAGFTYDNAGTVSWGWPSSSNVKSPSTSAVSVLSTYGVWSSAATSPTSAQLFPSTQYSIVAGTYVPLTESNAGCRSPNPGDWPQYTSAGKTYLAPAAPTASVTPGASPGINVGTLPMGSITVTNPTDQSANLYVRAVSATPFVSGDPGCTGKPQTIDFNSPILGKSKNSKVTITLPYGAWTLKTGTSTTPTTAVASASLSVPTGANGVTIGTAGAFTLDPRVMQ